MTLASQPSYVKAAATSVLASALLAVAPFAFAKVPLGPFIVLNWLLFMSVGYFVFRRPFRWKAFVEQSEPKKILAFRYALGAFTVAGGFAVFNAERIV